MEFIWHDGGRAASGFVGYAGDCAVRAYALATGEAYREIYQALGTEASASPRRGVPTDALADFLRARDWQCTSPPPADLRGWPPGPLLVFFCSRARASRGHVSCVISQTVYDTWNPFEDASFVAEAWWERPRESGIDSPPLSLAPASRAQPRGPTTQDQYERILRRVRALHRTASNHASTEGEIRNALRAMQALMLEHNLSGKDLLDEQPVDTIGMTRRACPLNGRRVCPWEKSLAHYLVNEVFTNVQFYIDRQGTRSLFWFFGPVDEVVQTLDLFREMLLTIATAAKLQYGGHARGSGASYAEGYVLGLPRQTPRATAGRSSSATDLQIKSRNLELHESAEEWLEAECGIRLRRKSASAARGSFDWRAHRNGTRDGAHHSPPERNHIRRLPAPKPSDQFNQ